MRVIKGWASDPTHELKEPFRSRNGVFIEFRGGDVCDPIDGGDWFGPNWPKRFMRFFVKWPVLPFISWRWGSRGGYIGAKAYGADPKQYLNWMLPGDVYPGSEALCFSFRPFADLTNSI